MADGRLEAWFERDTSSKAKAEHRLPYALCCKHWRRGIQRLFDGLDEKDAAKGETGGKVQSERASRERVGSISCGAAALEKKNPKPTPKPRGGKHAAAAVASASSPEKKKTEEELKKEAAIAEELSKVDIPQDLDAAQNTLAYHRARLINMEYRDTDIRKTTQDPDQLMECIFWYARSF